MRNLVASDATHGGRPRSSDRALQLLVTVGSSGPGGLTLAEASAAVELVPSTALRQLRSLVAAGLLSHDPGSHRYGVGPALRRLARQVVAADRIEEIARPRLDALAEQTGESCYLAVPEAPGRAVYVLTSPGIHALRHSGWLGRSFATRGTAVGAALGGRLSRGACAVRSDALEAGITAVAAPVLGAAGVVGAVNLVGPTFRLDGGARSRAEAAVILCAQTISDELGAPGR